MSNVGGVKAISHLPTEYFKCFLCYTTNQKASWQSSPQVSSSRNPWKKILKCVAFILIQKFSNVDERKQGKATKICHVSDGSISCCIKSWDKKTLNNSWLFGRERPVYIRKKYIFFKKFNYSYFLSRKTTRHWRDRGQKKVILAWF
jgi:hypothetical protein